MSQNDSDSDNSQSDREDRDEDAVEDEDLDAALASLDMDFDILGSMKSHQDESEEIEESSESPDAAHHLPSLQQRTEIFSKHYRPTSREKRQMQQIHKLWDVAITSSTSATVSSFFRGLSNASASSDDDHASYAPPTADQMIAASASTWQQLTSPDESNINILLKRGTLLFQGQHCEMVVLTQGLAVASLHQETGFLGRNKTSRHLITALKWNEVDFLEAVQGTTVWELHTKRRHVLEFVGSTAEDQTAWVACLQFALIQYTMRQSADSRMLGWQYALIYTPNFTLGATGENHGIELETSNLDELDDYNHLSPLHYACRNHHLQAARRLLEAGASPDIKDRDGKTAMYYAVRDQHEQLQALLSQHGAEPISEKTLRGELFGQVEHANAALRARKKAEQDEEQRQQDERQRQLDVHKARMAENMRLMQERGEQINELDDKAGELNEGARNYADFAKQLKEKAKKDSLFGGLFG